jgi:actin-related protein
MKCPKVTRPRFMENIFLCGEYANQPDLDVMINEELKTRTPEIPEKYIRVNTLSENPYFGWMGGSMIASMRSFNKWLTKEEFFQGKYYEKYLKLIIKGEIIDFIYVDKL